MNRKLFWVGIFLATASVMLLVLNLIYFETESGAILNIALLINFTVGSLVATSNYLELKRKSNSEI